MQVFSLGPFLALHAFIYFLLLCTGIIVFSMSASNKYNTMYNWRRNCDEKDLSAWLVVLHLSSLSYRSTAKFFLWWVEWKVCMRRSLIVNLMPNFLVEAHDDKSKAYISSENATKRSHFDLRRLRNGRRGSNLLCLICAFKPLWSILHDWQGMLPNFPRWKEVSDRHIDRPAPSWRRNDR